MGTRFSRVLSCGFYYAKTEFSVSGTSKMAREVSPKRGDFLSENVFVRKYSFGGISDRVSEVENATPRSTGE